MFDRLTIHYKIEVCLQGFREAIEAVEKQIRHLESMQELLKDADEAGSFHSYELKLMAEKFNRVFDKDES